LSSARSGLSLLSPPDQALIFSGTAQMVYPGLAVPPP
jgi:hypothetical protein